jgi:hypothetical protein
MVLAIFLVACASSIAVICGTKSQNQLINNTELVRPAYNASGKNVNLDVCISDKNGIKKEANIDVKVEPNRLNAFEKARLIAQVKEYLDKEVIGDNKNHNKVYTALNLVESYSEDKNITIDWKLDEEGIIDYKGEINHAYMKKKNITSKPIIITAIITYFEEEYHHDIELIVHSKKESKYTKLLTDIKQEITDANNVYAANGKLELPSTFGDYTVRYTEPKNTSLRDNLILVAVLALILIVVIIRYKENDFKKELATKQEELALSYSGIVSKLKMYVIAGLPIEQAYGKMCQDYLEERDEGHMLYAYEEMLYTYKDIEVGTPVVEAYTEWGKRVGVGAYTRLSSLMIQNIKSGTQGFVEALDMEVASMESKRKEMYIRRGGQLGAKLLIPMMIMMVLTLVVVMLPAFMSM